MAELRLSQTAERDLSDIFFNGAEQFGRTTAEHYRDGIKHLLALLAAHPLSARARADLGTDLRSRSYRSHVILYAVHNDVVLIARVVHAAMDATSYFDDGLADFDEGPAD